MKLPAAMEPQFLAPCGMNCLCCYKHCASPKPCPGCWAREEGKPGHCRSCAIRDCAQARGIETCAACGEILSLHDGVCSGCGRPALWGEEETR